VLKAGGNNLKTKKTKSVGNATKCFVAVGIGDFNEPMILNVPIKDLERFVSEIIRLSVKNEEALQVTIHPTLTVVDPPASKRKGRK
jgi:hypothetical protein